jgi:arsenate reductase-like glutaredoxin family protein
LGADLVVAVNVLVVVTLILVSVICEKAVRLVKLRLRREARLDAPSALNDAHRTDIIAPRTEDQTFEARRSIGSNQIRANRGELAVRTKCALPYEESDKLISELDKRSTLIDAQKTEIIALKIQIETLKARLKRASDDHDVQNLKDRLVEQSRRLNESEFELKDLRCEIEMAQKSEAVLRRAIIEIEGRANISNNNHEVEKAKLQAALDRANGEYARFAYELAKMKQQGERTRTTFVRQRAKGLVDRPELSGPAILKRTGQLGR